MERMIASCGLDLDRRMRGRLVQENLAVVDLGVHSYPVTLRGGGERLLSGMPHRDIIKVVVTRSNESSTETCAPVRRDVKVFFSHVRDP